MVLIKAKADGPIILQTTTDEVLKTVVPPHR